MTVLWVLLALVHSAVAAPLNPMTYEVSNEGLLEVTVDIDEYFYQDSLTGTKLWTRVYNRPASTGDTIYPGPVLKFRRGDTVKLTVNNNLGPETEVASDMNSYHYANTTNMHTHGLHISADTPQDNVFLTIHPQDSFTYIYQIPDDHAPGTFWYHAHHHGSTAIQVGGGMIGAIIIADEEGDVPPQIYSLPETVLIMSDTPVADLIEKYVCETGDALFTSPENEYYPDDRFVLVNGQYKPTGSLEQGLWTRLRLIFSGLNDAMELQMTSDSANCEWFLLAKDGIYVEGAPRSFGDTVYLGPGNRADVVMRCSSVGEVVLGAMSEDSTQVSQENIVTFTVFSSSSEPDADLPQFVPFRPDYLADLYNQTNTSKFELAFGAGGGGCTINGESWDGVTPLGYMATGSIQEWTVTGADRHPFHLHVNSYQLQGVSSDNNYFMEGDWHDVMYPPSGVSIDKYLFAVDSYDTKSIIHCHFLPHEDMGCMGYMEHTGNDGDTTGLTGHDMWCLGTSTGTSSFYPNCTEIPRA